MNYQKLLLIFIIGVHVFLLSRILFFPYPEMFVYTYLTENGLLPYKQILDQHFPGLMFLPFNFYSLGMRTPEIAFIWHLVLIALNHFVLYLVSRKIFKKKLLVLLPNLLYLVWQPFFEGYVLWIDSFMPVLLLSSLYFLMKEKDRISMVAAGLLIGVALVFKQVVGPLILLLSVYLLINRRIKDALFFTTTSSLPVLLMVIYIASTGVFQDFLYWTVTFNLTVFAETGRKHASLIELLKITPVFILSLLSGLYLQNRKKCHLALIFTFFIGSLMFAYARFDFVHLQPALPFAILLFTLFVKRINNKYLLVFMLLYLIVSGYLLIAFYEYAWGRRVPFFGEKEKKLVEVSSDYVGERDTTFAFATTPHFYYLTGTLPPGDVFVFHFPWFMEVAEDRILQGIIKDPPKLVIRDETASVQGMRLVDHMPKIRAYVSDNYTEVGKVEEIEIMVRRNDYD